MGMTKKHARSRIGEQPTSLKRIGPLKLALGALALLMVSGVLAQSGGSFALDPDVVASGGAISSSGGSYSLGSTVGQTGAGAVSGGSYTLYGGFWKPGTRIPNKLGGPVYVPAILKSLPPPTPTPTPPPSDCPDRESNEIPELSQPLTTLNGSCKGSFQNEPAKEIFDYYSLQLNKDQHIIVKLNGIPAGANYDISLQRKNGPNDFTTVDASGNPGNADELIDHTVQVTGLHYIRVKLTTKSPSATNTYILTVATN
jgi:hypothetical protein